MSEQKNQQIQQDELSSHQDRPSSNAKGIPSSQHQKALQLKAVIQNSSRMKRLQSFQDSADPYAVAQQWMEIEQLGMWFIATY